MNNYLIRVILLFVASVFIFTEYPVVAKLTSKLSKNPCRSKRSCHECIQTKSCAWCMQPDVMQPRCFHFAHANFCEEKFIWNPQTTPNRTINHNLTATKVVSIKLRINEIHNLKVRYSQSQDYPVDLYYLIDVSHSIEDDKKKITDLGDLLLNAMFNISSNFRLGFGSFVDKMLMPFNIHKYELNCVGCATPRGFKNVIPLSANTSRFATEVRNANIFANTDTPEGGLDAIMQAIVCRQEIGWRPQSRRLLVFLSDAGFHYAGDGKLAGVIVPNDEQCHLNSDGEYTHSAIQDYPSIAQINHKVIDNSINIIFVVTPNRLAVYNKLSQRIEGSCIAALSEDSSNVVELVKESYSKITSSVELKDNATSHVRITYHSSCLNGGPEVITSKCDGLKNGDAVNFTVQISVTTCPLDPAEWKQVIQIYPVGIKERFIINVEMLCSCPCETPDSSGYKIKSPECSNPAFSKRNKEINCRANNWTVVDCNGQGDCVDGVCECKKRSKPQEIISGQYCECDNYSCLRRDEKLCSGPDHGACECGNCVCKSEWIGTACECRLSNDRCFSPHSGKICSGRGTCECGVCKCRTTNYRHYSGEFCEKCSTCSSSLCQELRDCVQCQMFQTGPLRNNLDCNANCTVFAAKSVEKVEIDKQKKENVCIHYDENNCKFIFSYREIKDTIEVNAEIKLECSSKAYAFGILLSIQVSIVIIGLSTIFLWKLLTTIHDKRELAKLKRERMSANLPKYGCK